MQDKYVKVRFKNFPQWAVMRKVLCDSVHEPLILYIQFSIISIQYQIWITYINFKTLGEYLRELERGQSDRQTNKLNA